MPLDLYPPHRVLRRTALHRRPLHRGLVGLGLLAAGLMLFVAAGCKKDAPESAGEPDLKAPKAPEVTWPKRPADGTPVVGRFVKLIGEGKRRGVQVRFFNFADRDLATIDVVLTYLDATGNELGTWPQRVTAKVLVARKGHAAMHVGSMVPDGTTGVTVAVRSAGFSDGIAWSKLPASSP